MTEEEKKVYIDKSGGEKARYERQKKEFDTTGKFTAECADADKQTDESDGAEKA